MEMKDLVEVYNSNNPAFIISSNGNIGINRIVSAADERLEVLGNLRIEGHYYPHNDITYDIGSDKKKVRNTYTSNLYSSNVSIISSNDFSSLYIQQQNGNERLIEVYNSNNPAFIISSNGNIGINRIVSAADERLEVLGNLRIEGHYYPHDDITYDIGSDKKKVRNTYTSNLYSSNVSIISSNDFSSLYIQQQNENERVVEFYNSNNPAFIISSNGNIGINRIVSAADERLEVLGNLRIEGHYYPHDDITYDIGSDKKKVRNTYTSNLYSSNVSIISSNDFSSLYIQQQNGNERLSGSL